MRLAEIFRHSGQALGVTRDQLVGPGRGHKLAQRRQIVMTAARHYSTHSFPRIGLALGRDHTTIMHGVRQVGVRCAESADFHSKVSMVFAVLESEILHQRIADQNRLPPELVKARPAQLLLAPPQSHELPRPARRLWVAA